jgi:hypothetical protein
MDMSSAGLVKITQDVEFNPAVLEDIAGSIRGNLAYLNRLVDGVSLAVGDSKAVFLFDNVQSAARNIKSMDDLLYFRKTYNELLRHLKIYKDTPYGKELNKAARTISPDKEAALALKDKLDKIIRDSVEASPYHTSAEKKQALKNWDDANTLANEVYKAEATKLYKGISDSNKNGTEIAELILRRMSSQGGDYARIIGNLTEEEATAFEHNLIKRMIEKSTSKETDLIDYRELSKLLEPLKAQTANVHTRNAIEVIETYARLFGSDAEVAKLTSSFMPEMGMSRGLRSSLSGLVDYAMFGLGLVMFQANYLTARNAVSKTAIAQGLGKIVSSVPPLAKTLGKLDQSFVQYATKESIEANALEALKNAGSVQEFAKFALDMDTLPVKLRSAIVESADILTKELQKTEELLNKRGETIEMYKEQVQRAKQKAFEEAEEIKRQKDSFVRQNTPSLIETREAQQTRKQARKEATQVGETEPIAETIKRNRAEADAGFIPEERRIPAEPETGTIVIDSNGNPISNAGKDKGWGADRNVNVNQRTAEQDIKDSFLNVGIKNPTVQSEVVEEPLQLPPSKTIVTPQTREAAIDARLKRARDMSPREAFALQEGQPKIPKTTAKSREVHTAKEWEEVMSKGGIETTGKYNLPNSIASDPNLEDVLAAGEIAASNRKGAREVANFSGKARTPTGEVFTPQTTVATGALQTDLTPEAVKRIRAGKATPSDLADLEYELKLLNDAEYAADGNPFDAVSQIDSFMNAGIK